VSTRSTRSGPSWPRDFRLARLLAAVLAISVGVIHLAAVLHFTIIAHEVCTEHGHLAHSSQAEAYAHRSATQDAVAFEADSPEHSHDHCLPDAAGVDHVLVSERALTEITVDGLGVVRESPAAKCPHSGTDILLIAPKQSPPGFGIDRSAARAG
jgi:hypothetical protein